MNKKLINKILTEVSLDDRVKDGIFNIENDGHMEALREYLFNKGIDEESVKTFSNTILEGKYPERQAYNAKGILVTFPTPEYKADAIKRGTHFEKDPTKGQSNLFSDQPAKAAPASTSSSKDEPKTSEPKTSLPVSQASTSPSPESGAPANSIQPQTTAAPQQTPVSTPSVEPVMEPTELPPPKIASPAEKEANKTAIKKMLKGDDYMLDEVVDFIRFNAPHLMEEIKKKL